MKKKLFIIIAIVLSTFMITTNAKAFDYSKCIKTGIIGIFADPFGCKEEIEKATAEERAQLKKTYCNGSSNDGNFGVCVNFGETKKNAIDRCTSTKGSQEGNYACYIYTWNSTVNNPYYNTSVWTNKDPGCKFKKTNWDYDTCRDANLQNLVTFSTSDGKTKFTITHSGYNGVADFYNYETSRKGEIACENLKALHIVYMVVVIGAPILAIIFITFDLISSLMSGDPKKVSKFREKSVRRIIALIILCTLPVLISILVGTFSKNSSVKTTKYLKCVVKGTATTSSTKSKQKNEIITIDDKTSNNEKKSSNNGSSNNNNNNNNNNSKSTATMTTTEAGNKIAAAAKKHKTYAVKHGYGWCAKREKCVKKDKKGNCTKKVVTNPACKTKYAEKIFTSSNSQKKASCASLVSASLVTAGIYSKDDVNGHNVNAAWTTASYLISKGWTVVTNKNKLKKGDILFYNRSSKPLMSVPGMKNKQRPGHVDIYTGKGKKVYNTGSCLGSVTCDGVGSTFAFALRYPGK